MTRHAITPKDKRPTVRQIVLLVLGERGRTFKGMMEDILRHRLGSYGDTSARRLREMVAEGAIVKGETEDGRTYYDRASGQQVLQFAPRPADVPCETSSVWQNIKAASDAETWALITGAYVSKPAEPHPVAEAPQEIQSMGRNAEKLER